MSHASPSDISSDALIRSHGKDAPRVVEAMIDHAIRKGQHDEALELDRVRRRVKMMLVA
jgi:hypothetical protein